MTLNEIVATDRKIAYVDNTGGIVSGDKMMNDLVMAAVFADTTVLPGELSDMVALTFVQISSTERRAILNWA